MVVLRKTLTPKNSGCFCIWCSKRENMMFLCDAAMNIRYYLCHDCRKQSYKFLCEVDDQLIAQRESFRSLNDVSKAFDAALHDAKVAAGELPF